MFNVLNINQLHKKIIKILPDLLPVIIGTSTSKNRGSIVTGSFSWRNVLHGMGIEEGL